jgi:hypothetical protein
MTTKKDVAKFAAVKKLIQRVQKYNAPPYVVFWDSVAMEPSSLTIVEADMAVYFRDAGVGSYSKSFIFEPIDCSDMSITDVKDELKHNIRVYKKVSW